MMNISFSSYKQVQSLVNFPNGLYMDPLISWNRKEKVVVVIGATGTGKSRLSIDLATRFPAEIVNSDKMQVYKGLDIVTNKVTKEECKGITHHLLGIIDQEDDFTASDFQLHASNAIDSIIKKGRLPIIAGGSNSYIKALINDNVGFQSKYDCCFLCVHVSMSVLHSFAYERVDKMVNKGLIEEVRNLYHPEIDYNRGIKQAIGVPEMDIFLKSEKNYSIDESTKKKQLEEAIDKIKSNTFKLACRQVENIAKLEEELGWKMHRIDATEAFLKRGSSFESDEAWEEYVARPSSDIVGRFLEMGDFGSIDLSAPPSSTMVAAAIL